MSDTRRAPRLSLRAKCFFPILFVALLLPACKEQALPLADLSVVDAVSAYNTALIQCFWDVTFEHLKPVASLKEVRKIAAQIMALKDAESRMIARQDVFEVIGTNVLGETATLRSTEKWTYWWESMETGKLTKPPEEIKYNLIYNLKQTDAGWIVDSLELQEDPKDKKPSKKE